MTRSDRPTPPIDVSPLARDTNARQRVVPAAANGNDFAFFPESVPWVTASFSEIRTLPLDARSGFILSLIDGRADVDAIFDMSGMARDEVIAILAELVVLRVVVMR